MRQTFTITSPLSQTQKTIWQMITQGLPITTIAEKLNTTRQFVNQTKISAEAKLSTTLMDIAQANDFQITKLYSQQGILLGYHPVLKRKAILTYSTNYGIKVWYWHNNAEEVTNQEFLHQTRMYLLDVAKERGLEIQDAEKLHPARLATIIFSKLMPDAGLGDQQ
jgi:hypothetical protein